MHTLSLAHTHKRKAAKRDGDDGNDAHTLSYTCTHAHTHRRKATKIDGMVTMEMMQMIIRMHSRLDKKRANTRLLESTTMWWEMAAAMRYVCTYIYIYIYTKRVVCIRARL